MIRKGAPAMMGRRDPQRSLFEAQAWPHRVPEDSFYARMGAVNDVLFHDEDLAGLYCEDNGRPSLPPSLLSGITLLQFYEDVSDAEAIARLSFDLRWKVALNLPLDFAPPHSSSLSVFRSRLVQHGQERYAFNRMMQVGRAAGFLPDKITILVDTLAQRGAGAVQDTYTLIRKGIRRVLKLAGYQGPLKRRGLSANLAAYLDSDRKATLDWADPAARAAQLKVLVQDAEAVLDLAVDQADDPEVRAAAWLLTKILGDDVSSDETGQPQLGEGTARDRIVSLTDLEMRHGRKSAAQRFDGRKWQVAEEPTSELLVTLEPVPANVSDGRDLLPVIDQVEMRLNVTVERVIGDGAYGIGDNRANCAARGTDLVSPLAVPANPDVAKTAFAIDLTAGTVTCPQGQTTTTFTVSKDDYARPVKTFFFERKTCEACPRFEHCVHSKMQGRSIVLNYHEDLLQAARQRQGTAEFKDLYRQRPAVERKIAELSQHGAKQARYLGTIKNLLQAQWTGAVLNLKRLFKLFQGDLMWMHQVLNALT
jgi:transposase